MHGSYHTTHTHTHKMQARSQFKANANIRVYEQNIRAGVFK